MRRILFLTGQLNGGGAERVLLDILRHFDYRKNIVTLCQIVDGGTLANEIPPRVKKISLWDDYTIGYKLAYRLSNWFGIDYFIRRRMRKKIKFRHNLFISFLEGTPLKFHAILNPDSINVSWVHADLFNCPYEKGQFRKGEELKAYNNLDHIICVSNETRRAFLRRFPNVSTIVEVITNPIDKKKILSLSENESLEYDKFTIVTVGRLCKEKSMDRVVRLAHKFKSEGRDDMQFIIIGDGELRKDLEDMCKNYDVNDMVKFTGFLRNPYPYIKNADMLLSCSGYEGFSLVIAEAMCLGVPVVSTRTAGPMEIIDRDKYGLLCGHNDEAIYEAVKRMIDDQKLRRHYSKQALIRAKEFNASDTIHAIDNLK